MTHPPVRTHPAQSTHEPARGRFGRATPEAARPAPGEPGDDRLAAGEPARARDAHLAALSARVRASAYDVDPDAVAAAIIERLRAGRAL